GAGQGPAATALPDLREAVAAVAVAVVPARGDDPGQVVQHVIAVVRAGAAVHGRRDIRQPVQAVVGHGPVAVLVRTGAIGDRGDVADLVVVVDVVQELGAAVGVPAFLRQAAGVAGHRVDDAVAVGELLQRAVGEEADAGGVGLQRAARRARLAGDVGRLAQRFGCVVARRLRVLDRGPVAVGAVGVADVPDRLAVGLGLRLAGEQAALVVAVLVDHRRGAAAVGGGDRLRQ